MIIDRDIRPVVVTHDAPRVRVLHSASGKRLGKARDEAVHLAAADLQVDGGGGVIGIVADSRRVELVDRIPSPAVLVSELRPQPIDIAAAAFEREVSEHVIERAVLKVQDNNVVHLPRFAV